MHFEELSVAPVQCCCAWRFLASY